ncbi:MAG: hypothetical protein OXC98_01360 [bacterium]|nr:hypothetical protein [bacterium]
MLEAYAKMIPDAPERFMRILEGQPEHRMRMEEAESKRDDFGLRAASLLSTMIIGGGIYLVATGHDWAGASIISMNLVGLIGAFVYRSRNRE